MDKSEIRPSKLFYLVAVLIFVFGVVLFLNRLIGGLKEIGDMLDEKLEVPGSSIINLDEPGNYTVFFEYQSLIEGRVIYTDSINGLEASLRHVESNKEIELHSAQLNSNYSFNNYKGKSLLEFSIDMAGQYELKTRYPSDQGETAVLVVVKGFSSKLIKTILVSILIMVLSLALSAIVFIVIFIKRRKSIGRALQFNHSYQL
ncbi:MAG TPA: hypothetical protein VFD33_01680 [Bacillota bacterium]|nr:hypothetical protein [Bacillota bacterium]